jgi:hypothetical protein
MPLAVLFQEGAGIEGASAVARLYNRQLAAKTPQSGPRNTLRVVFVHEAHWPCEEPEKAGMAGIM